MFILDNQACALTLDNPLPLKRPEGAGGSSAVSPQHLREFPLGQEKSQTNSVLGLLIVTHTPFGGARSQVFLWQSVRAQIVGPAVTYTELARKALDRIVYVTDFSTSSLEALPYAVALAQDNEAQQFALVHIAGETTMGPFHYGNARNVIFRKRLDSLLGSTPGFLCKPEFIVEHGDRAKGLVRVAANVKASLIVMSARGISATASGRVSWFTGQIVCYAHCPVLMVRG